MKPKYFACWSVMTLISVASLGAAGPDLRLLDAVKHGDSAAVRALLKAGVDVKARAGDGASALHMAVWRGDQETTRLLIRAGAPVNVANDLGVTPLFVASSVAKPSLVDDLLKAGADPNTANSTGATPLMMASQVGDLESVKLLIAHGANLNAKESDHEQTALMWAVTHHHADVAQALIETGADIHSRSRAWKQLALACCWEFTEDPGVSMLVDFGGYTPLMYAAQQGDLESAKHLLKAGAKIDETAADGTTPFVIAAFAGRTALATFLLDQGADPNADGGGYTALHAAVLRDDVPLVNALIAHRANLNVRLARPTLVRPYRPDYAFNRRWMKATPFWLAAAFHDVELARILAAAGADPAMPRFDGTTPLIAAAATKKVIDIRPEFRRASTTFGLFRAPAADEEQKTLETVTFIVGLGVDVNAINDDGDTALHRAAVKRHVSVAKFLAEHGARLDIKNKEGRTPLALARADRPFPNVPSEGEPSLKVWAAVDAPRDKLVAVLRDLGAKE